MPILIMFIFFFFHHHHHIIIIYIIFLIFINLLFIELTIQNDRRRRTSRLHTFEQQKRPPSTHGKGNCPSMAS